MNIQDDKWFNETARIRALMSSVSPGTIVTYAELSELVNVEIKSQSVPLRRALLEMEKGGIVFSNVRSTGYRRASNFDIASVETPKHRLKTFRAAKRTVRKGSAVVESKLPSSVRVTYWANMAAVMTVAHDLHGNSIRAHRKPKAKSTTLKEALSGILKATV